MLHPSGSSVTTPSPLRHTAEVKRVYTLEIIHP